MKRFTTVTAAADSYDLTDLATVKDELDISNTAQDDRLGRYITAISRDLANRCNRVFPLEGLVDKFVPTGCAYRDAVILSRCPVVAYVTLPLAEDVAAGATALPLGTTAGVSAPRAGDPGLAVFAGIVPIDYLDLPPTEDVPIVRHIFGGDVQYVADLAGSRCTAAAAATAETIFDLAKNGTNFATMTFAAAGTTATFDGAAKSFELGDVLTVTPRRSDATLALLSGYLVGISAAAAPEESQPVSGLYIAPGSVVQAVVGNDVTITLPTTAAMPEGTLITFGLAVYHVASDDTMTGLVLNEDYLLDAEAGLLTRISSGSPIAWETTTLMVAYSAGYDPIPDDLADACTQAVVGRYRERGRDPALRSENLPGVGIWSYFGGGSEDASPFPRDVIERYRIPVVG